MSAKTSWLRCSIPAIRAVGYRRTQLTFAAHLKSNKLHGTRLSSGSWRRRPQCPLDPPHANGDMGRLAPFYISFSVFFTLHPCFLWYY